LAIVFLEKAGPAGQALGQARAGDGEWSEFNLIGICSNRRQGWQVAILFLTTLVLDAWLGVLSIEGSV
jgi:hypothetical protein